MNDELSDFPPHDPLDSRLLQLERELFSLTPVEAPRRFAQLLETPARSTCAVGKVIPVPVGTFKWSRIVVPAAAAVVVVSVLQTLDPARPTRVVTGQTGQMDRADLGQQPAAVAGPGRTYVLKAEPIYLSPVSPGVVTPSLTVQPGIQPGLYLGFPRRNAGTLPVSFH